MKRKAQQDPQTPTTTFPIDDLHQDLLEKILSHLPPAAFSRLRSVCRRWSTVSSSPSFQLSCSQIPRDPFYLMVGLHHLSHPTIFDSGERNWKSLPYPPPHSAPPVAASGGLVCYLDGSQTLTVSNPLTDVCRKLPKVAHATLHAIAMSSSQSHSSYRTVIVSGETYDSLCFRVFDSLSSQWEDEVLLVKDDSNSLEQEEPVHFLNKAGAVVTASTQRSPSKQYSSVITVENGDQIVYFLSETGTVVGCNLDQRRVFECPRLLPVCFEYSIDLVECGGEMLVVVLAEFFETASLRVWRFEKEGRVWRQVAAMPPAMSRGFYGKRADVNCVGCGGSILVCVSYGEVSSYVICEVEGNRWEELPKCSVGGKGMEFMSAFCFEPRLEASV